MVSGSRAAARRPPALAFGSPGDAPADRAPSAARPPANSTPSAISAAISDGTQSSTGTAAGTGAFAGAVDPGAATSRPRSPTTRMPDAAIPATISRAIASARSRAHWRRLDARPLRCRLAALHPLVRPEVHHPVVETHAQAGRPERGVERADGFGLGLRQGPVGEVGPLLEGARPQSGQAFEHPQDAGPVVARRGRSRSCARARRPRPSGRSAGRAGGDTRTTVVRRPRRTRAASPASRCTASRNPSGPTAATDDGRYPGQRPQGHDDVEPGLIEVLDDPPDLCIVGLRESLAADHDARASGARGPRARDRSMRVIGGGSPPSTPATPGHGERGPPRDAAPGRRSGPPGPVSRGARRMNTPPGRSSCRSSEARCGAGASPRAAGARRRAVSPPWPPFVGPRPDRGYPPDPAPTQPRRTVESGHERSRSATSGPTSTPTTSGPSAPASSTDRTRTRSRSRCRRRGSPAGPGRRSTAT